MSRHTPGPWRYSEIWRPPIGRGPHETNAEGNVSYGYSISGSNEHGESILPTLAAVHNFPDNMLANARLIAAAPETAAELERAQKTIADLVEALRKHHAWHQKIGVVGIRDEDDDWIELDLSNEYADAGLCDQTISALSRAETSDAD